MVDSPEMSNELSKPLHEIDEACSNRLNRGTEQMLRWSLIHRFEKRLLDDVRRDGKRRVYLLTFA
jgi:hypothetical protein